MRPHFQKFIETACDASPFFTAALWVIMQSFPDTKGVTA
jgi:hypothetical protein